MTDLFPDNVFTDVQELKTFILAGNARFSVRSEKTMRHFTYKARKPSDGQTTFIHRLAFGGTYVYLGTIFPNGDFIPTRKTSPSEIGGEAFIAFDWLWRWLNDRGRMPLNVTIWHEGRCGMCGRDLTDPVSIKAGYGPDCRRIMLRHGMIYDKT